MMKATASAMILAEYIAIAAVLIIRFVILFSKKRKKKMIPVLIWTLLVVNVSILCLVLIGSRPRNLAPWEKKYIYDFLEEKYGDRQFKILTAKAESEALTGWENMFRFKAFDWSELKAVVADENGHPFTIVGFKKPFFMKITMLFDDYDVLSAAYENTRLFQNKVTDIETEPEEFYWKANAREAYDSGSYYVDLFLDINYSEFTSEEFNEQSEMVLMETLNSYILEHGYCKNIRIFVDYTMSDGILEYRYIFFGNREYNGAERPGNPRSRSPRLC